MEALMTVFQSLLMIAAVNSAAVLRLLNAGTAVTVIYCIAAALWYIKFSTAPTLKKQPAKRIKALRNSVRLLEVFLVSATASIAFLVWLICFSDMSVSEIILNTVIAAAAEFILFWNGTIRLYLTSVQLGIKWRVIGAVCGMIPVLNIAVLVKTIRIASAECRFEREKLELDSIRAESALCRTKYPLLLVHGVFFRDFRFFNYWGRIPAALKRNGAEIYYGNQQSAASVENSARELAGRIESIVKETGCGKVNIIAHSKGGLDARYALSHLGADKYTASLTTVNTPHRGCQFADYILGKVSASFCQSVADKYNSAMKLAGDENPDFIAAVTDLTASRCSEFNEKCPDADGVYYQSIGSKSENARGGKFPLNLSYHLVKYFDGDNDGLVSVDSMKWGESFTMLAPKGKRGVTHGDVIDLNRENIKGFDVREFYVGVVKDLKDKGL
ncbi:triacylglycerol lipase [Ruminococcus sp. Marseille-P6503]|uniref:esterase/lipase family protein n=1 Tax=Ruminococcus sp. Marseille-P6503 TaxID=2364796 RepID=UPI000F542510|nr:triacylglycerol lipase [Ruminococcus sp. Marseille-P6503]